jgi:hypothetical protein
MRPFNRWKVQTNNEKICTRKGLSVRIICYDAKGSKPIIALVHNPLEKAEFVVKYYKDGTYHDNGKEHMYDLFLKDKWQYQKPFEFKIEL